MIRTMPRSSLALLLALVAAPAFAAPQPPPADPSNGRRLAERWCAACHLVAAGQTVASTDAPSFAALANAPGKPPESIADFLALPGTTHSKMPDMSLSRVEIGDIVAYVATLKK